MFLFRKVKALREVAKTEPFEFNKRPAVAKKIELEALNYAQAKVPFVWSKPKVIGGGVSFFTAIYEASAMIPSGDLITIVGFIAGLSLAILALKSIVRDYHLVLEQRTIHQDDYILHTAQEQQQTEKV